MDLFYRIEWPCHSVIFNIIELFNSEVSLKLINLAWYSSNQDDNKIRYELTKKGIENFLSKCY